MPQSIIERQQPKYWQGSIRWLTNTEKRKLRRQNTKDAGKWALSSIYNAITDLPSRLARVPAAWVDQIAWTDIQWTIEDLQSAPSKALRNSASNSKMFDKWQEYTDDALMAAALLWAWRIWWTSNTVKSSWAKQPLTNEIMNLERIDEALKKTNIPKYVEMTNNPKNVSKWFTKTQVWVWKDWLKVEDMPAYVQKRISNLYNEAHYNYKEPRKSSRMSDFAWVTKEWEIPNNWSYARYIPDEWLKMAEEKRANNLWNAREMWKNALRRTSRARANATKKRNMSARERAARERAEDSANELKAAWRWRWAKKVQTTLDDIAFEDWFASLEDAERFARADWFKSYRDAKLAWRDYRALNEQLIARNELDATRARADVADQTLEEMFEEWKRLNRQ